jgi:hypothetical protein
VAAAVLAGSILGACSGSGGNLAAPPNLAATTVAGGLGGSAAGDGTTSDVTASDTSDSTTPNEVATFAPSPTVSPTDSSKAAPASIVDVPEVGVPGLDSTDAFCSSWSRFAGSFQVVAVNAAFGSGSQEQLAALEVAAAPTVTAAYAELLANWPSQLASEYGVVADEFLGPFARRLTEAFDSLAGVGADQATIEAIADAWLTGLASRDPSTPEFVVDLPGGIWDTIDDAAALFGARLVPFGADPSLVTDVSTPLTTEYLAAACPDQGTLSGQEVETP